MVRFPLSMLVAIVAVVSLLAAGTARLAAAPAGAFAMVICSEGGATTVVVDAQGNPVPEGPAHRHCSDCFVAGADALPAAPSAAARAGRLGRTARPRRARQEARRAWGLPEARGPPREGRT